MTKSKAKPKQEGKQVRKLLEYAGLGTGEKSSLLMHFLRWQTKRLNKRSILTKLPRHLINTLAPLASRLTATAMHLAILLFLGLQFLIPSQ